MKAQDLIDILSKNPDLDVVLSADEEGNEFHALTESCVMYVDKTYTEGDLDPLDVIGAEELSSQLEKVDDDPLEVFKPVVVLWP